jgi:hypothetical protein
LIRQEISEQNVVCAWTDKATAESYLNNQYLIIFIKNIVNFISYKTININRFYFVIFNLLFLINEVFYVATKSKHLIRQEISEQNVVCAWTDKAIFLV